MKGLLYKDLCQAKRSCRFIGVAVLVHDGDSSVCNEKRQLAHGDCRDADRHHPYVPADAKTASGWCVYQRTLPLSAEQIVGCKYLVGLCMAGIAGLLAGGSGLLAWVVNGADLPQGVVIRSVALAVLMSLAATSCCCR